MEKEVFDSRDMTILIVDDEPRIRDFVRMNLEMEHYRVVEASNGIEALEQLREDLPDLVVLDVMMPEMDGFETLRNIREVSTVPVIMLTVRQNEQDKIRGLDLGADDYIAKPFSPRELLSRIRTQIRRVQQNYLSPLIGLPGGLQVELAIKHKLSSLESWSILYLDLDNFKAFNDVYGFLTGNDIIRLVGRICQRVVREFGNGDDFVGHIGGDDFVVVTTPDRAGMLCKEISAAYKEESAAYYRPEDLRRGSISGVDRKGRIYQFPLVSLSIGVVNNQGRRSHSLEEVSYLAAEAKYYAKQSTSNVYHISPRRDVTSPDRATSYPTTPPYLPPLGGQYIDNPYEDDYYSPVEVGNRAEFEQRV